MEQHRCKCGKVAEVCWDCVLDKTSKLDLCRRTLRGTRHTLTRIENAPAEKVRNIAIREIERISTVLNEEDGEYIEGVGQVPYPHRQIKSCCKCKCSIPEPKIKNIAHYGWICEDCIEAMLARLKKIISEERKKSGV
jgi:hypothetical protein